MALLRTSLLAFGAGVAAGATAYATYPRWKHKFGPLISAAVAGATAAFHDAQAADGNLHTAHVEPRGGASRNGTGAPIPVHP
jgi:hypothetical protein